jgi:hypothetical protein
MGYDRIAYFEGMDADSTLISGDKQSSYVVYGPEFRKFLGGLGFKTKFVIDKRDIWELAPLEDIIIEATIRDLPESTKTEVVPGQRLGIGFLEVKPPIPDDTIAVLNKYFETHCQPDDAGLILDYRSEPVQVIGGF